jgi:hypothetical protein
MPDFFNHLHSEEQGLFDAFREPESLESKTKRKGILGKMIERAKILFDNPEQFKQYMLESALHSDNVKDFIADNHPNLNSLMNEAIRKDNENINGFFFPYNGFISKHKEKMGLCKELENDPNNPKWKKGSGGHCY